MVIKLTLQSFTKVWNKFTLRDMCKWIQKPSSFKIVLKPLNLHSSMTEKNQNIFFRKNILKRSRKFTLQNSMKLSGRLRCRLQQSARSAFKNIYKRLDKLTFSNAEVELVCKTSFWWHPKHQRIVHMVVVPGHISAHAYNQFVLKGDILKWSSCCLGVWLSSQIGPSLKLECLSNWYYSLRKEFAVRVSKLFSSKVSSREWIPSSRLLKETHTNLSIRLLIIVQVWI